MAGTSCTAAYTKSGAEAMKIVIELQPTHAAMLKRLLAEANEVARLRGEIYDERAMVASIVESVLEDDALMAGEITVN
jgi:prephenate dehydratase